MPDPRFEPKSNPPKVLVLAASPRRDGNSWRLATAFHESALSSGQDSEIVYLSDHINAFLRDCRTCRNEEGRCSIDDGYRALFEDKVLSADALVYATPIWWYGMSGILKTFFDRMFCYIALSNPQSDKAADRLQWKRVALLLSAEESNFSARLAIMQQMQELARYLNHMLVGEVTGIGNRRGDIDADPNRPIAAARALAENLFAVAATDYKLDTERSASVWADDPGIPANWR
ncbi:MAG: flavodoxin family protein [Rhodospirillales bacterium]